MQRDFTTFQRPSRFSFEDRQALDDVLAHARALRLVSATKTAYWWLRTEGWRFSPLRYLERRESESFDRRHGTDTAARVELSALAIDSTNKDRGVYYQASPVRSMRAVLRGLGIKYEDFTFIDFGSGKGRTLLIAAELPFRRVIGVEFSPELHVYASRNIALVGRRRAGHVESVIADATEYSLPSGNLVLYFFNPFDEVVLRQVVANIVRTLAASPRRAYVVYHYLPNRALFETEGGFRLVRQWHRFSVFEWRGAATQAATLARPPAAPCNASQTRASGIEVQR